MVQKKTNIKIDALLETLINNAHIIMPTTQRKFRKRKIKGLIENGYECHILIRKDIITGRQLPWIYCYATENTIEINVLPIWIEEHVKTDEQLAAYAAHRLKGNIK